MPTLLRIVLPAATTTEEYNTFKEFKNRRVVLKGIRFTRSYDVSNALTTFNDIPHVLSLNLGSWFQQVDESHCHKIRRNDSAATGTDIDTISSSNFNILLSPTCSNMLNTPSGFYYGFLSYDMKLDYDFGIIEYIPQHFNISASIYEADGTLMSTASTPAIEVIFEIS